jgi:Uma2 family endonuclease
MTVDEFLSLPDDGVHRELIEGEVRVVRLEPEDDPNAPLLPVSGAKIAMTTRNRFHSRLEAKFAMHLGIWLENQPEPRGEILCGEVGFKLAGTRESLVGIDVAYASAELVASVDPDEPSYFDGPPTLAVEVLSPSDTHEDIVSMIALYLKHGVVVWVVDPDLHTVAVYQAGELPQLFNEGQNLVGDPYLPGFRVAVSRLFGR